MHGLLIDQIQILQCQMIARNAAATTKKKEIIQERSSEILPALESPTYNAGKANALCSATERNWDIWTEIEQLEVQSGLVTRVWSIDTDIGG